MPLPDEILETVDELYRDHASIKDFNSVSDVVKGFVETKAMVGNSIRIPSKDAGPEAYEEYLNKIINNDPSLMKKPNFEERDQSHEFFRTIGLPQDATGYENPEGMKLEEGIESEMRELLYNANTTQAGYEKVMLAFSERQNQTESMNTEMRDTDMSGLKEKWGQATDDRMKAAQRANEEFYPGRNFDKLTGKELESLFNISKAMTGKGAPAAGDSLGVTSDVMTPQEANIRAEELMNRARNAKPNEMTREEIQSLMKQGMDLKVKYAGYEGTIDSLRA